MLFYIYKIVQLLILPNLTLYTQSVNISANNYPLLPSSQIVCRFGEKICPNYMSLYNTNVTLMLLSYYNLNYLLLSLLSILSFIFLILFIKDNFVK